MAKSQSFIVTTTFTEVKIDAVAIQDGTFSVFNKGGGRIESVFGTVVPTAANGDVFTDEGKETDRVKLSGSDRWYVKTDTGTVNASVIRS